MEHDPPSGPQPPPRPVRRPIAPPPPTMGGHDPLAARLAALQERGRGPAGGAAAPRRSARRHPAATARVGAIGLSLASTVGLTAYFAQTSNSSPRQTGAAAVVSQPSATAPSGDPGSSPATAAPTTAPPPRSNTVVNGATFENRWGPVQVQATFGPTGRLVAADALQTPAGRGRSIDINHHAVPQLDAEATAIQSAQVDTVSGATYTSTDYRRSLQSAIDVARASNVTALS